MDRLEEIKVMIESNLERRRIIRKKEARYQADLSALKESARRILIDVHEDRFLFRGAMMQFLRYNHHYLWVLMKWDKFGSIDGLYNNLSGKVGNRRRKRRDDQD